MVLLANFSSDINPYSIVSFEHNNSGTRRNECPFNVVVGVLAKKNLLRCLCFYQLRFKNASKCLFKIRNNIVDVFDTERDAE